MSLKTCVHAKKLQSCLTLWNPMDYSPLGGEGNGTPLQYSCLENPMDRGARRAVVHGFARSRTGLSDFTFTFHFHALEKAMATHFSVLAWRIPGTGEPDGLPSLGLHRVGHNWSDLVAAAAASRLSQRSTLGWKSLWSPRQFWGSWTAMSKRIMVNSYLPIREKINSKCITDLNIKANGIQH